MGQWWQDFYGCGQDPTTTVQDEDHVGLRADAGRIFFSASNCVCMGWMGFNGTQKHWDGQNMSKFKKSMELIWWSLMRLLKLIHIGLVKQRAICWCTHTGDLMDCCCVSDPGGSTQILQRSHKAPWLFRHLSAPDLAVGKLTVCYWTWPFSSLIFPW